MTLPSSDATNPSLASIPHRQLPDTALIIDPHGLWDAPLDKLPSFDGRVQWKRTTSPCPPETGEFSIRFAKSPSECQSGAKPRKGCVTLLIDAVIPIGLQGCGAVMACSREMMPTVAASVAGAILTVSLANHVARYGWQDALEVISRDVLLVAAAADDIDTDTIARCASQTLAYFQGASRIEPEAVVLGAIASEREPPRLRVFSNLASVIRSMAGLNCYQIVAFHVSEKLQPRAFLVATFPIPVLPGQRVRPRIHWPR